MCSARHLYLSGCISALLHCGVNIKKDDLPSAHKRCSQRKAMLSRQLLLLNAHKRCPSSSVLWKVFAQTTERTDVYMLPGRSACVDGDAEMPFAIITPKNKCAPACPSRPTATAYSCLVSRGLRLTSGQLRCARVYLGPCTKPPCTTVYV